MHYYALITGIVIAFYVVIRFRKTRLEKKKWVYPAFLATFPMYYWAFAIYASDYDALVNELVVGVGFLVIALVAYKFNSFISLVLLAIGYMAHAGYDVIHNSLFYNPGTPVWWPEFCGSVDVLIGIYLLYFAFLVKNRRLKFA